MSSVIPGPLPWLPDDQIQRLNLTQLAFYYTTHAVPQSHGPGQVVASIAVAYFGAWCTIFLLARRTSIGGARNIILLVLAAIVMSTLGVWGMHFVGMHMDLRPTPGIRWHIVLNPGFTAMSLLVTILGSIVAFLFIDAVRFTLWRVIASGVLLGGVIALMHFSASFHANFKTTYRPLETVMAILLAMAAATAALTLFFHPRMQSGKRWWRRLLTSAALATSVSGMHYTGMAGTSFMVRRRDAFEPIRLMTSRRVDLVVALPIPIIATLVLLLCFGIHLVDRREEMVQGQAAREVVVCSTAFNAKGELLVKEQGGLPMVVIKTPLRQSEVRDALDSRQPTFQWLYAVSWQWDLVADWIRGIGLRFLRDQEGNEDKKEASVTDSSSDDGHMPNLFERIGHRGRSTSTLDFDDPAMREFRDRVIDAARQLAVELDIAFQDIGVLYDQPIITGTRKTQDKFGRTAKGKAMTIKREVDEEQGSTDQSLSRSHSSHSSMTGVTVETTTQPPLPLSFWDRLTRKRNSATDDGEDREGIVLCLVRRLEGTPDTPGGLTAEEEHYLHRGYRMMDLRFLGAPFADRYNVTKADANAMLKALQTYAKRGTMPLVQPSGVYAGLFGVRASTSRYGGLETLVYGFARQQIPAFRLPKVEKLTPVLRRFVRRLDQISLQEAMEECTAESLRIKERINAVSVKLEEAHSTDDEEDLTTEADLLAEREQFVLSLHSAFEAMIQAVRVYPSLPISARVSAELLQLPSSKDDSTEPAEVIIVHAVLPEESSDQIDPSLPLPSDRPQEGTPFVFTPYSVFHKAQVMMMQGKLARDFEHEVRREMKRRYHTWSVGIATEEAENFGASAPREDRQRSKRAPSLLIPPAYNAGGSAMSKTISGRRSSDTPSTVTNLPPTISERFWSILTAGWGATTRRRAQQMPMMKTPQRPLELPDVATLARLSSRLDDSDSPTSPSFSAKMSGVEEGKESLELQNQQQSPQSPGASGSSKTPRSLTTIPEDPRRSKSSHNPPGGGGRGTATILLPAMMSWPSNKRTYKASTIPLSPSSPTPSGRDAILGPPGTKTKSSAPVSRRASVSSAASTKMEGLSREHPGLSARSAEEIEMSVTTSLGGESSASGSSGRGGASTMASPTPTPTLYPSLAWPFDLPASATMSATGAREVDSSSLGRAPQTPASSLPTSPSIALSPGTGTGTGTGTSTVSGASPLPAPIFTTTTTDPLAPAVVPIWNRNAASLEARVRCDGWTTRYLREIERSPAGPSLLGVDY